MSVLLREYCVLSQEYCTTLPEVLRQIGDGKAYGG